MDRNPSNDLFTDQTLIPETSQQILEAGKWAKWIVIISSTMMVLLLVFILGAGSLVGKYLAKDMEGMEGSQAIGGIFTAVMLIVFVIVGSIVGVFLYFLYKFYNLTRKGIENRNQDMFNEGLGGLKSYLIINGVLVILALLFTVPSLFTLL